MGKIESNNAKMTLQNVTAKFQCNITIVQSLYESIKDKSILKIKANLYCWFSLMLIRNNGTEATILNI